ncbi:MULTISPECIES: NAD-dependent succinate-semialdehyde dehydrogenase [unclassified Streptomyces]|uniref:NAD-dependent succinate-semialdehyde dehydrogenase n=1 Tax=unclassified Streptomyces TaxID=2593676 RepID=UPI00136D6864|nr:MULTISPECIES: NAD-dependent succinate-semialdehyde dehydrogenase [unclassified Streptomyces]MCW5251392.1 NAD-dependent succinate-semialdehyde dehydrogenase [Streptomyces sp. SHP 1-2]MYU22538.1 aldehyde dehydrogenase family protein [Streptomyces sp. SID8352]
MTTPTAPVTAQVRGREIPVGLYVDGAWTPAAGTFPVVNPADGRTVAEVADGTVGQALGALDAAVAAQDGWRHVLPRERADLFHRAHRLLLERADEIVETMTLESGKPLGEARGEFQLSADFFLWYAEQIAHLHGTYAHGSRGDYRIVTTHQPVGPCLLITPWNFPLLMIARKAGAALAAGCAVVVKSAKETPLTCALFVRALHDAGFPAGVVNLVHTTSSAKVSAALMADSRLRKVSFTGSTGVGSTLLGQAAANITNASMELGGDGPFLVLDDADLELAAEQAVLCKFRNAGQACVAANRIIVDSRVAEEFTARFVALTEKLRVGDGFDPDTEIGPIISARQRDTVRELVDGFRETGATLLTGGREVPGDGFFFEPTVFSMAGAAAGDICRRELFAPIAAIYPVDSVAEAVAAANDTGYGLAAYVFTRDVDRAIAVSERLDFGMVGVNRGVMADPAAPFGGIKASGLGREGGHEAIHEFLEPKYLAITVNGTGAGL